MAAESGHAQVVDHEKALSVGGEGGDSERQCGGRVLEEDVDGVRRVQVGGVAPKLAEVVHVVEEVVDQVDVLPVHGHHQFVVVVQVDEDDVEVDGHFVVRPQAGVLAREVVLRGQVLVVVFREQKRNVHVRVRELFQRAEVNLHLSGTRLRQVHEAFLEVHANVVQRVEGLRLPVALEAAAPGEPEAQPAHGALFHRMPGAFETGGFTGGASPGVLVSVVHVAEMALVVLKEHVVSADAHLLRVFFGANARGRDHLEVVFADQGVGRLVVARVQERVSVANEVREVSEQGPLEVEEALQNDHRLGLRVVSVARDVVRKGGREVVAVLESP